MPIIDLQMRIRELGRIRIGDTQPTKSGKTRPSKLSKFRITSASRPLLEKVAQLYGGEVHDWTPQNSSLQQFEVYTDATRLPVLVPPNPVSQWYETWSGGGCQRRCDGAHEVLSDKPCLCGPDPAQRQCKPTTRVNVMLREVEGVGVWRLETHGYHAAVELPQAAEFLARGGGYIDGYLTLEERRVVRDGETRQFMVPALDIGVTAGQLLAGGGAPGQQLDAGQPQQIAAGQPAQLPAAPTVDVDNVRAAIAAVTTVDDLRAMWAGIKTAGLTDEATARAKALQAETEAEHPKEMPVDAAGPSAGDADVAWSEVMRAVPEDWSTTQVEQDFEAFAGVPAEQGTAQQMREYLVALPGRAKAGA